MSSDVEAANLSSARDEEIQRARDLLDAYHDRELTDSEREFVEHALATYPELTKESSIIVGIKNVLSRYEGVEVASDFSDKLLHRLQDEKKALSRAAIIRRVILFSGIGLLSIALILWLLLRG